MADATPYRYPGRHAAMDQDVDSLYPHDLPPRVRPTRLPSMRIGNSSMGPIKTLPIDLRFVFGDPGLRPAVNSYRSDLFSSAVYLPLGSSTARTEKGNRASSLRHTSRRIRHASSTWRPAGKEPDQKRIRLDGPDARHRAGANVPKSAKAGRTPPLTREVTSLASWGPQTDMAVIHHHGRSPRNPEDGHTPHGTPPHSTTSLTFTGWGNSGAVTPRHALHSSRAASIGAPAGLFPDTTV